MIKKGRSRNRLPKHPRLEDALRKKI